MTRDTRLRLRAKPGIKWIVIDCFKGNYLDEQAYRFNTRKEMNDAGRFANVMGNAAGRRLTWKHLTGKDQSSSTE